MIADGHCLQLMEFRMGFCHLGIGIPDTDPPVPRALQTVLFPSGKGTQKEGGGSLQARDEEYPGLW